MVKARRAPGRAHLGEQWLSNPNTVVPVDNAITRAGQRGKCAPMLIGLGCRKMTRIGSWKI